MSAAVRNNSPKRNGSCSLRSTKGVAVLDETYSYIVECTSKTESYAAVLDADGLPLIGQTSPTGLGVCRSKKADMREANPLIWDVVCEFSSEVEEGSNINDPTTDPVAWVPVYETKSRQISEVVINDLAGTAIANSAGQPFPVGLTVNRKIPVWEFFQIEPPISDEAVLDRNETINSATFKTKPAKSLLLEVLSSQIGYYYGAKRRLTQYSISYNKKLWTHKRLDVGTVYLSGGDLEPYLDNSGKVINGGLDGSGAKVTAGSPPAIRSFEQFTQLAFASFLRI